MSNTQGHIQYLPWILSGEILALRDLEPDAAPVRQEVELVEDGRLEPVYHPSVDNE